MITPAADYRPIDKRPARWSSAMNPLSLQKRGLVHWIPLGALDSAHRIAADRRYRPAVEVALAANWFADEYRGIYGAVLSAEAGVPLFVPVVTTVPLSITCWIRRTPGFVQGINVWLGQVSPSTWNGFFLQVESAAVKAIQVENTTFGVATANLSVPVQDWVFCAGVFVSNADRWAYCNGVSSAHNTDPFTPAAAKDALILNGTSVAAAPANPIGCTLRDVRVYDYALELGELEELYRNPYDLFQVFDRDDDYQFFTATASFDAITLPVLTTTVGLHTPTITTAALPDLEFQVSVLSVAVTAHTPASVALEEEVIQEDERELEPHNLKVRIVDFIGGDDLRISRTYTQLPEGIIISKGYLTIKRRAVDDADAEAIIQKQITASESIAGQLTDATTTGGSIDLYFDLTSDETATLTPLIPYQYDIQIISLAGAVYTCEKGVIVMQQGVTEATS